MAVLADYLLSLLPVSPQPLQGNTGTHFLYMYHLPPRVYINPRPSLSQQRLEAPGLTLSPLSGVWGRTRVGPAPSAGLRGPARSMGTEGRPHGAAVCLGEGEPGWVGSDHTKGGWPATGQ